MTEDLKTEADLAEKLLLTPAQVAELRRRHGWPHVRMGRSIRFTDAQFDQIVERHTVEATVPPLRESALSAPTSRSAARRRSA